METTILTKSFSTILTLVRFITSVSMKVSLEIIALIKSFSTVLTLARFITSMYTKMSSEMWSCNWYNLQKLSWHFWQVKHWGLAARQLELCWKCKSKFAFKTKKKELFVVYTSKKRLLCYCDCDLTLGNHHWMINVV